MRREVVDPPATTLEKPSIVLIESDPAVREALRSVLEGWGLRVLEPDLTSMVPVSDEHATASAIIADFELEGLRSEGLPFTGLDVAMLITRRALRRIPILVLSSAYGRLAIPACSPHRIPVLFKPVPEDTLRAWLSSMSVLLRNVQR